jgi:branched-chain amino acid transport system permease protein
MVYHLQLNQALGPTLKFLGLTLDAKGVQSWLGAGLVLVSGIGLFEFTRRRFILEWSRIQEEIEAAIQAREAVHE